MADLSTWANVAEILGLATVVGGAFFAWFQIREARKTRADASSLRVLVNFLEDERFFLAVNAVMKLPPDWHMDKAIREDPETVEAVNRVYQTLEMLGYFVYARQVRLKDVQELAGSGISQAWVKMRGYVDVAREERGPNAFEWYEWLIDRLEDLGEPQQPAHVGHANWKP